MKKFWLSGWTKALLFALCLIPLRQSAVARLCERPDREPDRVHHPFHRRLDAAVSADHAGCHSVARAAASAAIDPVPADAGAVCVFLRPAASDYVDLARSSGFDVGEMWEDVVKRRFITSGMIGVAADGSARRDFDRRVGAAFGICAMAAAAPVDLSERARGRDSLLLGRQVGYPDAGALWRDPGGVAAVSGGHGFAVAV